MSGDPRGSPGHPFRGGGGRSPRPGRPHGAGDPGRRRAGARDAASPIPGPQPSCRASAARSAWRASTRMASSRTPQAGDPLGPRFGQPIQQVPGPPMPCRVQLALPPEPGKGGDALEGCPPPHRHGHILSEEVPHHPRGWVLNAQGDDGGRIPEPQRPSSRSASRAFKARPLGSLGRGSFQKVLGRWAVPSRIRPARSNSSRWGGKAGTPSAPPPPPSASPGPPWIPSSDCSGHFWMYRQGCLRRAGMAAGGTARLQAMAAPGRGTKTGPPVGQAASKPRAGQRSAAARRVGWLMAYPVRSGGGRHRVCRRPRARCGARPGGRPARRWRTSCHPPFGTWLS